MPDPTHLTIDESNALVHIFDTMPFLSDVASVVPRADDGTITAADLLEYLLLLSVSLNVVAEKYDELTEQFGTRRTDKSDIVPGFDPTQPVVETVQGALLAGRPLDAPHGHIENLGWEGDEWGATDDLIRILRSPTDHADVHFEWATTTYRRIDVEHLERVRDGCKPEQSKHACIHCEAMIVYYGGRFNVWADLRGDSRCPGTSSDADRRHVPYDNVVGL